MLTNQQTFEKYGLSLEEWRALTPSQRNGRAATLRRKIRRLCDCGNEAEVVVNGEKICQRCARAQRNFNAFDRDKSLGHAAITEEYSFRSNKTSTKVSSY